MTQKCTTAIEFEAKVEARIALFSSIYDAIVSRVTGVENSYGARISMEPSDWPRSDPKGAEPTTSRTSHLGVLIGPL